MEFWRTLSERARLIFLGIFLILFSTLGVRVFNLKDTNSHEIIVLANPPTKVTVYVTGAVVKPGVYTLSPGTRVKDAIAAAGGPSKTWNPLGINLAKRLDDEDMVVVPQRGTPTLPRQSSTPKMKGSQSISLNQATLADFETLPGVGPGMAKRILDYRSAHGSFRSVEGLRKVEGIGEKKFQRMKPFLQL